MKSRLILFAAVLCSSTTSLAQETKPPAGLSAESLHLLLETTRDEKKVPALAAAVVQADGRITSDAVGTRKVKSKKNPVTADDCFHLGSCTKSMTATLCAILVDKGQLSWDRTIEKAFPELVETIHPDWHNVTLEQLLCHRSGLPEDRSPDLRTWPKIRALKGPLPEQRNAMMEIIFARPSATPAGSAFAYSNYGFAIAGAMCEAAAGKPYEELMQSLLFEPLGITTAGFGSPGSAKDVDQPWGHDSLMGAYSSVKPGPFGDNPMVISPAGLAHMSLGDWAKYARLHLQGFQGKGAGGGLLKPETLKRLHTVAPGQDYAYGWLIRDEPWAEGTTLAHNGSNNRWYAVVQIAPMKGYAVMAATNAADQGAQEACRDVLRGVRSVLVGKTP